MTPGSRFALLVLLLAVAMAGGQARAGTEPERASPAPTWQELDSRQQADLVRFAQGWNRLPPERRAHILQRYLRWQELPAERRETLRQGERNFRQMSVDQRRKIRASLGTVRALPPEEQRRLRQQWRSLTPQQRRDWLERGGPGIAPPP